MSRNALKDNQEKLISDIKMRGFGYSQEKQRELFDLELLADLRHYGSPSCLIDFTSDFLIALWFACHGEKEKAQDGRVFILNCYDTSIFSVVSSNTIEERIGHFFQKKFQKLWYWVPERLNQRLTDQDAVFIFGETKIEDCNSIEVENGDKEEILKELEKFFDYSRPTLFSDKYALGESYKRLNRPENILEEAVYYIQVGKFSKAVELLKQLAMKDNLQKEKEALFLEANFQLAYVYMEQVKEDIKKEIKNLSLSDSMNQPFKNGLKEIEKDLVKKVHHHINILESSDKNDCNQNYKKHFDICIDKEYKKEKIALLKKIMKNILYGLQEEYLLQGEGKDDGKS